MKKFTLMLFMLSIFAGCATESKVSIAMIIKQSDPWFDDMTLGIEKFKKDTGVNAYVLTPESGDPALQIQLIENLIAQNVSAITIVPNDPEALIPVIRKAREAGIIVVTHEAPNIAQYVDLDIEAFKNEDFGALMGKSLAEAMGGTGQYAGFVGGLTMTTHTAWYNAAVQYIQANYPNMQLVSKEPYEDKNNIQVAYDRTIEILKAYPNIKGIFDSSAHGGGISQALVDQGRTDVKVASLAIPSMAGNYIKDGTMAHGQAWRPADAGYATAYAAYLLVEKKPVETGVNLNAPGYESVTVDGNTVYGNASLVFTKENVDSFKF